MVYLMDTQQLKRVLLVGQSVIYLIAFSSIYYQIPALYGETGIAPVAAKLEKCNSEAPFSCASPLVFILSQQLSVKPSTALQIVALLGIFFAVSTIAIRSTRTFIFYSLLVVLYLSIVKVGDTFMYFQWDSLVLESGWMMAVLAATANSPADMISTYLVRFLAARLMFASGIVKLQSLCPTWWGLSALDIHFESQCLPTQLAWAAHHQPKWMRRLGVALTFFVEIYLPPMFLLPIPMLRALAAIPNIAFMIAIMATGNYNFFNLHFALLCVACLEGGYSSTIHSRGLGRLLVEFGATVVIFGTAAVHWAEMFGLQYDPASTTFLSNITFSKSEFAKMTKVGTSVFIHVAIVGFVFVVLQFLLNVWQSEQPADVAEHRKKKGENGQKMPDSDKQPGSIFGSTGRHAFFVFLFGSFLFWTSFVPFTQIDEAAANRIPDALREAHVRTRHLELTHSYGLFRRMTGAEGRPEIVLEGAHEPNGPWREIEFFAKPGDVNTAPVVVFPHQPRLDWQMWFAALGAYHHNPWFLSLVNRLLHSDPNVIGQLGEWRFTNKKKPLKFLRAQLYHYRFAEPGSKFWWTRSLQHEYMPALAKDSPAVIEFLSQNNLIATKTYKAGKIDEAIARLHIQACQLSQTTFVWSTTAVGLMLSLFI